MEMHCQTFEHNLATYKPINLLSHTLTYANPNYLEQYDNNSSTF